MPDQHLRCVAVAFCAPYLGLVLLQGDQILAMRTPRLRSGHDRQRHLGKFLNRFIRRHGAHMLVVEARIVPQLERAAIDVEVRPLRLTAAKEALLGTPTARHVALYRELLTRDPHLQRFVPLPINRVLIHRQPFRKVRLHAIALGLAARRRA